MQRCCVTSTRAALKKLPESPYRDKKGKITGRRKIVQVGPEGGEGLKRKNIDVERREKVKEDVQGGWSCQLGLLVKWSGLAGAGGQG